ncbi:MAG: hypothetical protein ACI8UO_000989 [Verrucomicrobiales bacterium]|jgi:hypothetical protein
MKSILICISTTIGLAAFAFAAEETKETTVSGKVICAHCDLGIGDSCNSAVQQGKTVYLLNGGVAKKFFDENAKAKVVTATGKQTKKADHVDLAVSKIALKTKS